MPQIVATPFKLSLQTLISEPAQLSKTTFLCFGSFCLCRVQILPPGKKLGWSYFSPCFSLLQIHSPLLPVVKCLGIAVFRFFFSYSEKANQVPVIVMAKRSKADLKGCRFWDPIIDHWFHMYYLYSLQSLLKCSYFISILWTKDQRF